MASFPNQLGPGSFVPTTNVWDVSEIYSTNVTSDEFKELLVRLYQNLNIMSLNLNIKDTAYYPLTEFVTGEAFFPNPTLSSTSGKSPVLRQGFRLTINFGALPNTGSKSVAHGLTITSGYIFTRILGAASDQTGSRYIPLPFSSPIASENIKIEVDATNVVITTGSNRSAYTETIVILYYIKE